MALAAIDIRWRPVQTDGVPRASAGGEQWRVNIEGWMVVGWGVGVGEFFNLGD